MDTDFYKQSDYLKKYLKSNTDLQEFVNPPEQTADDIWEQKREDQLRESSSQGIKTVVRSSKKLILLICSIAVFIFVLLTTRS